jgi:hypothetical protein
MNTKGLSMLLCLSLLAAAHAATPQGATVQDFVVNDKGVPNHSTREVRLTILNQSDLPISCYTVRIEMTMPDGSQTFAEETEDSGPRGKALLAHQSIEKTYDLGTDASVIKPRIVVVIYNNGTAESEKKETLDKFSPCDKRP